MHTEPTREHAWLKRFVGEWTYETQCPGKPGEPPMKMRGRESVRMIGELWVVGESRGEMPGGGAMTSLMTLGYDPAKKKFVGTWIGSPMANLFVYEGQLDASGRVLPLDTTGPSFTDPGKTVRYQDVVELHEDGRRLLWSQAMGDDGTWQKFMTAEYRRAD